MGQLFANNAVATLASGITNVATSATLATGLGALFPSPTGGDFFQITFTQAGTETSWEIATCTARSGDVLTITRGQEHTTAAAWATADKAELRNTARSITPIPAVRQTVLSGPVGSSGEAAFGGSTGSTVVTASGTLHATVAAGYDTNYTGSILNPSWTGLSTNGTMYLFLDITDIGICTTSSTTLVPVYQWGDTYSVTSGQNTFNIQEMTMKVGNGASASQVYRVCVGEVTVAGGVVTAITWYALMGRYDSGTASLPATNTAVSKAHNIGIADLLVKFIITCTSAELNYAVGDSVEDAVSWNGSWGMPVPTWKNRLNCGFAGDATAAWLRIQNKTAPTGASGITLANWNYKLVVNRSW